MFGRENAHSLESKVAETIERTDHLVSLVAVERLTWRPELPHGQPAASDLGHVLGHLLDCLAGFCAVFHAAYPSELADFGALKSLPVNRSCIPEDARRQMKIYAEHIHRGFQQSTDVDLSRRIPTLFVAEGETLLSLLLGNLEHLISHKYQLFFHLKLAGVAVNSRDIYTWRGTAEG
ncbi:MAG TPA: DinB family protein [Candidatus Acidoferrum sp.]|nr:DinB family protein [Candidatus Acidoferrum sp.]